MHPNRNNWWSVGLVAALTLALGSQVAALLMISAGRMLHAVAWHLVAALASALAGFRAAVGGGADARPQFAAVVAFSFALTLPVLGLLGLVWVLLPHWVSARRKDEDRVLELELPEFHETEQIGVDAEGGVSTIEDELSEGRPVEQRVRSVMALRRMDPQRAVPLLRVALADPSEDVRLLAYAILERREKQIRRRITQALASLRSGAATRLGDTERAVVVRGLANDHWELVYGGFSEGEGERLNLEQAAKWADEALHARFDGTLAILLARVRLKQGRAAEAWQLIVAAERGGVATDVCAPLLAEAAFLLREFECIPRLLAHVDGNPLRAPRLQPVARFWNAGGDQ